MRKNTETTPAEETVSAIDDRRRFYAERLRAEIPANWDIHNIGDLCNIRTGKLDVNQADEEGKYPFFTCAEKVYRINTHAFEAEAVLVAGNGFFNVKYYKGKFNAYQRTYVLSDIKTDAKFLYYYVDYRLRDITGESRGSTISYIRLGDLRDYPVAVAPPDQQKRIVAEIEKQFSRLDEAVANLKRVKANLKRYKASVLKSAVEGKLTEDWRKQHSDVEQASKLLERILAERRAKWKGRGKYKDPVKPETVNLPALPNSWIWTTFEQISLRVTVGHVGPMKHEYVPKGIPFLRSQNVRENKFDAEGLLFIRPEFHSKLSKSVIRSGDLAVVRSGSVGITCVIPDTLGEANCADLVLIQSPLGLVPQFGAYYMNSMAKRHIEAGKVGIALTHFNTRSVAAMPVPLPPLAEQERIVGEVERRLSVIEKLQAAVEADLTRADYLQQSILCEAFSGQLVKERSNSYLSAIAT